MLAAQTAASRVQPVFFGSAITGAGLDVLSAGITELLPAAHGDADGPVSGTVFKIERGPAGDKVAYVRLFAGTLRHAGVGGRRRRGPDEKVTAISVFEQGAAVPRSSFSAGQIAKVWGLGSSRVGDAVGLPRPASEHAFAPPTLETVVEPRRGAGRGALHTALTLLAEQDPLISVRQDELRGELSVSLFGEVQKEVIEATLAADFGVEVAFRETTTICIERLVGSGAAFELIDVDPNPFLATVGLRVDPAPVGAGVEFRLEVELGSMPYSFFAAVEETVRTTLLQGLVRLGDPGLHGDDDALRLLPPAESHARHVRQEHVQHGRRLPQPHPAGPDDRVAPGRHDGARADAPLPARAAGGHPRVDPAGAGPARRHPDADRSRARPACSRATSRRRTCTGCSSSCPG